MKPKAITIALLAIALLATGCGDDDSTQSADSSGNQADAMFVAGMIPHHQSAIDMANLGADEASHEEIKQLSKDIIASQLVEVDQMNVLKQDLPPTDDSMMSEDEMAAMRRDVESLKNADDFDKAFIDAMIPHHQAAVTMANDVIANGKNPEVKALAQSIVKAQSEEISDMQSWRVEWYGKPLPNAESSSMGPMHSDH